VCAVANTCFEGATDYAGREVDLTIDDFKTRALPSNVEILALIGCTEIREADCLFPTCRLSPSSCLQELAMPLADALVKSQI
jgi:hypothetical protein